MAEKSIYVKPVARKRRHQPINADTSRTRVTKTTHNHDAQPSKPGRFIRTEKSASYNDNSKESIPADLQHSNQRQGTFVKEDSVTLNELVHPRIDSSSQPKVLPATMAQNSADEITSLENAPESTGIRSNSKPKSNNSGATSADPIARDNTGVDAQFAQPKPDSVGPQSDKKGDSDLEEFTLDSRQNTQDINDDKSVVESVQNISPKERNVIVVSGGATPVNQPNATTPAHNQTVKSDINDGAPNAGIDSTVTLEPPLVITLPDEDIAADFKDTPRDNFANVDTLDLNLLSVASEKSNSPPPQVSNEDLEDNWDQRRHSPPTSARTEKSAVPGEPILYKKPIKSAKRKAVYDPQEMIRNASRQQEEESKPIYGTNWGTSKPEDHSLEDERVLKLTEMLNQMGAQLSRYDADNQLLKSKNEALHAQNKEYSAAQDKANAEIELIKREWQTLTKDMEEKQADNERLKQEARSNMGDDERMRGLNDEQVKLRLENSALKSDMKELLTARQNENTAQSLRIKELEALMITKEADVETVKSNAETRNTEYENELKALREQIERLKVENRSLQEEVDVLKAEVQRQSEVIARLNSTTQSESKELRTLRDKIHILTEEKLKFQIENTGLKDRIVELENELEKLKITIQNLNKENQHLVDALANAQKERDDFKDAATRVTYFEQALELANKEKEYAQKTLQERQQALATDYISQEQLKMALQNAETQNEKLSKEVNNLSEENATLKLQMSSRSADVEQLKLKVVELNERAQNNSITLSSMADLVKEKQSHIEDLRKEIQTLKSTNSNYFSTLENITSSRRQDDDVVKSKYSDMESAHKKLLEENKRLRTVVAHKNMSETNQDSEKQDLRDKLYEGEKQLSDAHERIEHLEAMLDDVYKAREITGSRISKENGFFEDDFKSHHGKNSLPEIQSNVKFEQGMRRPNRRGEPLNKRREMLVESANTSLSGRSGDMRRYRYANSYTKRFENRPSKLKKSGVVTQLQ